MRKKLYIILLLLSVTRLISSCSLFNIGHLGRCSSTSIENAREIGTFLSEYVPYRVKINDSIQFTIKQVFAEKQYGYYSHADPSYTIQNNKSQIVVILEKKIDDVKGFSYTWGFDKLGYDRAERLSIEYNDSIPPDTIQIDILRVDINSVTGRAGSRDDEIIGHFTLRKKFNKNMH